MSYKDTDAMRFPSRPQLCGLALAGVFSFLFLPSVQAGATATPAGKQASRAPAMLQLAAGKLTGFVGSHLKEMNANLDHMDKMLKQTARPKSA